MRQEMVVGRSLARSVWGLPFVSRHFSPPSRHRFRFEGGREREKVNEFHWDRESFSPLLSSPLRCACVRRKSLKARWSASDDGAPSFRFRFYSSMRVHFIHWGTIHNHD